jgi:hypothetical protein
MFTFSNKFLLPLIVFYGARGAIAVLSWGKLLTDSKTANGRNCWIALQFAIGIVLHAR